MKQTLLTSFATRFDYLMFGEEVVVRNFKKVIALFEVHFKDCPEEIKHILATPEFEGSKAKEQIIWSTNLFQSKPRQLSSLDEEERLKYREILQNELESIKEVLVTLPYDMASFLLKAITYYDESTVFCADDKVVLAEWGMHPKGDFAVHMLSLEGVKPKRSKNNTTDSTDGQQEEETLEEPAVDNPDQEEPSSDTETETETGAASEVPVATGTPSQEEEPSPDSGDEEGTQEEDEGNGGDKGNDKDKDKDKDKKKRRWWLWLLLGLLLALLLFLLLRGCDKDDNNTPPPPVDEEDLEWVDNTRIVNNRLILLFSDQMSVDEFVKAFRAKYPNTKKYQLYIPDYDLPRIVLTLPSSEREEMKNRLPIEFSEFDLMVLYESVFGSEKTFNDPAFSDAQKSWYFDMIKVSNAWDRTTGSPNLIVAVIDDGFDLEHPELKKKDIVKPYNAVTHNNKVFPIPNSGHGTHVAATAVGIADNNEGTAGIAPDCKLMPIQVANKKGVMTTSAIVDAVLYAIKNGADVVNMSLGKQFNTLASSLPVEVQKQIITTEFLEEEKMWKKIFGMGMTNGKDIAFVIAGGNFNILVGIDPMQRVPGTIRVSAVEASKKKAGFSNFGEYSVLSAPGVEIYNAVSGKEKYAFYKGTSMASPIVAGAYALMKSYYTSMSVADITKLLQHTGIPSLSQVGNIINFADAFNYMESPGEKPIFNDPKDPTDPVNGDPNKEQPIQRNPETGEPIQTNPGTGRPIDPVTGQPAPTDPVTGNPIYKDPITGKPAPTDPVTGNPIYKDPITGKPAPIDPGTGNPIYKDPVTGYPAPINPETGKPIYTDPTTGRPAPVDPNTGKPIYKDPETGKPVPVDPKTGKPIYKDPATGNPVHIDPVTGQPAPVDPRTNEPIYNDPVTGQPAPIDPRTGRPIYTDPVTGQPVQTDPWTGKPIYTDPWTGRPAPVNPETNRPIYQDPVTGQPTPVDPGTGKPIYNDPETGRPAPVNPETNKPIYQNPEQPVVDPCPDCTESQRRYQELLRQIEELKKANPGCY